MIEITLADFKLIKSFYPEFSRAKGIRSNRFILDWNQLMPLVKKIIKISSATNIVLIPIDHRYDCKIKEGLVRKNLSFADINSTYTSVFEFIKWYNENEKATPNP